MSALQRLSSAVKKQDYACEPTSNGSGASDYYEVWVLDTGEWTLNSYWRDFEVAWAVADVHSGPVQIVRAKYEHGKEFERDTVVELRVPAKKAEPDRLAHDQSPTTCVSVSPA